MPPSGVGQSVKPCWHCRLHALCTQSSALSHVVPQPPQLKRSCAVSTQPPSHSIVPPPHVEPHVLDEQKRPAPHALPHAPQFCESTCGGGTMECDGGCVDTAHD